MDACLYIHMVGMNMNLKFNDNFFILSIKLIIFTQKIIKNNVETPRIKDM